MANDIDLLALNAAISINSLIDFTPSGSKRTASIQLDVIQAIRTALLARGIDPNEPLPPAESVAQGGEWREKLQRQWAEWGAYWRAPDAHGVELTEDQAIELLAEVLGVEVEIKRPCGTWPDGRECTKAHGHKGPCELWTGFNPS